MDKQTEDNGYQIVSEKYEQLFVVEKDEDKREGWQMAVSRAETICGMLEEHFLINLARSSGNVVVLSPAAEILKDFTLGVLPDEPDGRIYVKDNVSGRIFDQHDGTAGSIVDLMLTVMGLKRDDMHVIVASVGNEDDSQYKKIGKYIRSSSNGLSYLSKMDRDSRFVNVSENKAGRKKIREVTIDPYGLFRNSGSLSSKQEHSMIVAIRVLNDDDNTVLHLSETDTGDKEDRKRSLRYVTEINNRLISFDENSSCELKSLADEGTNAGRFCRSIYETIISTFENLGKTPDEIYIDGYGIIKYVLTGDHYADEGYIGQVFVPDENGLVKTTFKDAGSDYWFIPGYYARIVPIKDEENDRRSLEERTRLHGYTQMICESVRVQLIRDMYCEYDYRMQYGYETSINDVYRKLYEDRYDYDYLDCSIENEHNRLDADIRKAIVETYSRRVRYPSWIGEKTGIGAIVDEDSWNRFTGSQSIYLIGNNGYFDPDATSSGKNQGLVRYLVSGACVNEDGSITPSDRADDRAPLFNNAFLASYSKYNPFDRNQMVFSNLMRAYCVTKPVKTRMMTCGGWTFDDGFVVSYEFAHEYRVPKTDNHKEKSGLRDLMIGDKMLDRGGNKGVISLIVNRDEEPDKDDVLLWNVWKIFKDDPELQVIESPYSGRSRFNGATARELIDNSGRARFIITQHFADKKTNIYDDEDYQEGKTRKASSQLSWALASKDAKEIIREFYGYNGRNLKDLNMMLTILDFGYIQTGPEVEYTYINSGDISSTEDLINTDYLTSIDNKIYLLPERLRKGITLENGRYIDNDLTRKYVRCINAFLNGGSSDEVEKLNRSIRRTIFRDFFKEKDNFVKSHIMSKPLPKSSTAIWTADPRLDIEKIAVSTGIAKQLDVNVGDWLLIWRDPILRDASIRYMQIDRIDDDLAGIAINPVSDKCFDGDFDGDTVAVVKLRTEEAHKEAIEKFSFANNLIDLGKAKIDGKSRLFINHGLDLLTAEENDAELAASYKKLCSMIEDLKPDSGETDRTDALIRLNEYVRKAFISSIGQASVNTGSPESVIWSYTEDGSITKAKKTDKDNSYIKYFNGKATDEDRTNVQKATAIKAAVGIAGAYSQRGMRALRNICPKAVLELTYPNTQALLQIKHDPERAVIVYEKLREFKDLWEGKGPEYKETKKLMDKEEFISTIYDFYVNELDQKDIDKAYIIEVADALLKEDGEMTSLSKMLGTGIDNLAYSTAKNYIDMIGEAKKPVLHAIPGYEEGNSPEDVGFVELFGGRYTQLFLHESGY